MVNTDLFTNVYKKVAEHSNLFLFIFIGGRGIGKTYSMLKESLLNDRKILYVRRTQTELENTVTPELNPFKTINTDLNRDVQVVPAKDIAVIQENDNFIGYAIALSTSGKYRGVDFSDIDLIIFDEFINTSDHGKIKNEHEKIYNLLETVNRNRELFGYDPAPLVCLSNANTIDNDLLRNLNLASIIMEMKTTGGTLYIDDERGIYLELLENKKLVDMKSKTKLYKLTRGTAFQDMALGNDFTKDYFGDTKKLDFKEFIPIVSIDHLYFYKHKSKDLIYVAKRKANCKHYNSNQIKLFKQNYGYMLQAYHDQMMLYFQNYNIKLEFEHLFC